MYTNSIPVAFHATTVPPRASQLHTDLDTLRAGRRIRRLSIAGVAVASALMFAPSAAAQGDPYAFDWANVHHEPAGTQAAGLTSVVHVIGDARHTYTFIYDGSSIGDDVIRYQINLNSPDVQDGLISVKELTTGAEPITVGGLKWRPAGAPPVTPLVHRSMLISSTMTTNYNSNTEKLTLKYTQETDIDGAQGSESVITKKKYRFWLEGKTLIIRAWATTHLGTPVPGTQDPLAWEDNYAGFLAGPSAATPSAGEQHIPGMESVPVIKFAPTTGGTAYYSLLTDWYRSNATTLDVQPPTSTGNSYEFGWETDYNRDLSDELLAMVDERLSLTVTTHVYDVFPLIPYAQSDFYDQTKGQMNLLVTGAAKTPHAYARIDLHFKKLLEWGMTQMSGIVHGWSKYDLNVMPASSYTSASILGCDPAAIEYTGNTVSSVSTPPFDVVEIDPDTTANEALVQAEFRGLMTRATSTNGWLFGLYQNSGMIDPQGSVTAVPQQYPTAVPLSQKPSKKPKAGGGTERIGVVVPPVNSSYASFASQIVEDRTGFPKPGWDTSANLKDSSWDEVLGDPDLGQLGHKLESIAYNHRRDYWTSQLATAKTKYGPNLLYVDAYGTLPRLHSIDEVPGSGKPRTIGSALTEKVRAIWEYKSDPSINGDKPLFGEPNHQRKYQFDSYFAGIVDGVRRYIPAGLLGANTIGSEDAPIIPDYELRHVKPRSAGHAGMGSESGNFRVSTPLTVPYDDESLNPGFMNAWLTNTVTFNHSAYATTSGHTLKTHWTMEGLLRNYYLITPLQSEYREAGVDNVVAIYYEVAGTEVELDAALAANYDFKNARVHILYTNGLEIYANHDLVNSTPMAVSVPGVGTMQVPGDGFVAFQPSGLLVFSAFNPELPGSQSRIDYASVPGKHEMISCRGTAQTFRGFPSTSLLAEFDYDYQNTAFSKATVIENHQIVGSNGGGLLIGADRGEWNFDRNAPNQGSWVSGSGLGVVRVDLPLISVPN